MVVVEEGSTGRCTTGPYAARVKDACSISLVSMPVCRAWCTRSRPTGKGAKIQGTSPTPVGDARGRRGLPLPETARASHSVDHLRPLTGEPSRKAALQRGAPTRRGR